MGKNMLLVEFNKNGSMDLKNNLTPLQLNYVKEVLMVMCRREIFDFLDEGNEEQPND